MDGVVGIVRIEQGKEIMTHLGYPDISTILGAAKVLGVGAILQSRFATLKEWAYAGFTFHVLGKCASRAYAGDSSALIISPLVFMGVMFRSYSLRRKLGEDNEIHTTQAGLSV